MSSEENLAPARPTHREAASIPLGQPDRRGAALFRGRIEVKGPLDLGRWDQQRFSRAEASQSVLQVRRFHGA